MDIDTINLNQEITDLIIKEIDFPVLISKLMDLVNVNIQRPQDNESFVLIERALDLLSSVLIYTPEFLEFFYSNPSLQGLIMSGLLDNPYQPIREAIKNTISILIETIHETTGVDLPRSFFLTVLINNLTKETSLYCDEYFELLNRLVYICHYNDLELLNRCLEVIIYREIKENRTIGNQDKVITGHLRLASTLIELIPDIKTNLSVYVEYFYMFLFDIPTTIDKNINQPPKFKHLDTRKAGFGLLLSLCASCHSNMQILIDKLYQNHPDNKYYANLDSGITLRSKTSYVGLKNFGSTCYMNSLMQQFYMIPALRNGLLDSKISISQQSEDNLLFQLQNLMANLSESEKEYYEPGGFTIAFKDFEGNSMNVSVQQDVDEFFNLLCDRLEEILKNTQNAKLFRNTIGGSLVHEIVSCEENLPYRGEREEQFLRISLDIKNKKNLAEALDLYIKEDTLEGDNKYFCDLYNQKITAKKRCLLYSMSNTVFIHLKRFDFDFTRMVRHKINDYFEFPMELNLKPWTKDGVENVNDKPNSYYQYELKGVLVHSGSAESGHYYSFIKDRKTENWLKFDDRNVDYFNIDHLKEETFGGDSNNGWSSSGQYYQFTKSAYMLIYERINPLEISEDLDIDESNYICKKSEIFSKIWTENMEFLRDMLLFDENYYDFIKSVIENYDFGVSSDYLPVMSESRNLIYERGFTNFILMEPSRIQMSPQEIFDSPEYRELYKLMETEAGNIDQLESSDYALKAIKIATLFSYELLIRAKNYSAFRTLTVLLTLLYRKNGHACLWFIKYLAQNSTLFIEVLFECKDPQVRFDFSELLSHVLVHTSCIELQILHVNENIININQLPSYKYPVTALTEDLYFKRSKSATGRFIEQYLHYYLQEARKNWRRFNEFFNVLKGFVSAGVNQTRIVVDKGGIYNLLSLYMNGVSPFLDKTIMGDQATDPDLDEVLEILKILICSSKTQGMQLTRTYPP